MDLSVYEQYLDVRKYGTVPHSGFGLGFERLLLFATGAHCVGRALRGQRARRGARHVCHAARACLRAPCRPGCVALCAVRFAMVL